MPIFFFQVSDPVGAGLVDELGKPTGTNITGRVFTVPQNVRLALVMRLVGQTTKKRPIRFGYVHSDYPSTMGDIRGLRALEKQRVDVKFLTHRLQYKKMPTGLPEMMEDVKKGVAKLSGRVDFWWQPQGPLGESNGYSALLLKSAKPVALGQAPKSVEMGALFSIVPDLEAGGREAAQMVDAFLKGTKPGDIPVVPPVRFKISLNLTTALRLKIVIPEDILEMAHGNIHK